MIRLINFKKSYKNNTIFKDVNIEFASKKITFIMRPNSVGKTTLIKSIFELEYSLKSFEILEHHIFHSLRNELYQ